jgi:hypothetical protein
MNIRLRAGVEVLVGTVGLIFLIVLANAGLDLLIANYGIQSIAYLGIVVLLGIFMNLVYQVRLSQLKYTEKLKEIVEKKG